MRAERRWPIKRSLLCFSASSRVHPLRKPKITEHVRIAGNMSRALHTVRDPIREREQNSNGNRDVGITESVQAMEYEDFPEDGETKGEHGIGNRAAAIRLTYVRVRDDNGTSR